MPHRNPEVSVQPAELLRLVVENVKEYAIFANDERGTVVSWNPGVERLLGYTEDQIVGQPISIIFTPEDRAAGVPGKKKTKAAEIGCAEDKRWHQRRDGSLFWANGLVIRSKMTTESVLRSNRQTASEHSRGTEIGVRLSLKLRMLEQSQLFCFSDNDFKAFFASGMVSTAIPMLVNAPKMQ